MSLSFFLCEEETGRFNYVFSTNFTPTDFSGILASGYADRFAIDNKEALFHVALNGAVKVTVHGVVLEHVSHVINRKKVVDSNYFDVVSLGGSTEHETSDAAKAIDTYFSHNVI